MRSSWLVLVSSALLFTTGPMGVHPAPDALALCLAPSDYVQTPLVILEFYPCAVSNDEYLVLSNRASVAVNLLDWAVSDGEGVIVFSGLTLLPGEMLSVSENASSYLSAYGEVPDIHLPGWTSGIGADVTGRFRLADSGDEVCIYSPDGAVSDAVAYGDVVPATAEWSGAPVPAIREGEVVCRLSGEDMVDTDSALDWTHFRESRYGHTSYAVTSSLVSAGSLKSFTSPDCSLDVVLQALSSSKSSIRLCAYELSSSPVCVALLDALLRGVDVRVLVDAMPVGGMSDAEIASLSHLAREGVDVRVLGGNLDADIVRHVAALHSKYIIVDGLLLVALSENFVPSGVPFDRLFGNRGWGVAVADQHLSSFMTSVFDSDSRMGRLDVWSWPEDARYEVRSVIAEEPPSTHTEGMVAPWTSAEVAEVSLYLSPDVSATEPFIVPFISGSREVTFEQFQADLTWTTRWSDFPVVNPVLDAVGHVLAAGGSAKGVLDNSWFNVDGNQEAVSYLCARAIASGAPPSFCTLSEASPISVMHNKGLVLEDSAIVSSNNWVYPSFAKNRELAVVVRCEEVASYFLSAFRLDWEPDVCAPVADAGPDVEVTTPGDVLLDASGSWDDRALAHVSWDLDGDGHEDASSMQVVLCADRPGAFTARLTVTDAWGNVAMDTVTVTLASDAALADPSVGVQVSVPWALPACLSAAAVALLASRKLNLLRPSTRGKG